MKSTGCGVGRSAKLSTRVKLREDHLDATESGLGFLVNGNATAGIADLNGLVLVQDDLDSRPMPRKCFINRIVYDFPQAVHESPGIS